MDVLAKRAGLHRATVSEFNGQVLGPIKPLRETAWRELEAHLAAVRITEAVTVPSAAAA
jgi:hypothetical protein